VFILKQVKVLCFDTLLQVFILKVVSESGPTGKRRALIGEKLLGAENCSGMFRRETVLESGVNNKRNTANDFL